MIFAVISVVYAQNYGRYYKPPTLPTSYSYQLKPGQYRPDPGRYRPDNTGRYSNNDGKYRPSDDGKYHPDDSGRYTHIDVGGGQYQGSKDIIPPYKDSQGSNGPNYGGQTTKAPKVPIVVQPLDFVKVDGPGIGDINNKYSGANGQSTLGLPSGLEQGSAAGLYDNRNYRIIVDEKRPHRDGDYHYKYETENKIFGEERGIPVGNGDEADVAATGYYKYTGPDNIIYTVNYHAGEEGFVAEAIHIPTPPPIPDLILRALKYQRDAGELDDESIDVYLANSN